MNLEERVQVLELELHRVHARNRRVHVVLGACLAIGIVGWMSGMGPAWATGSHAPPSQVRANSFIVEDEHGNPRALLSGKSGASLVLLDEKGNARVSLIMPDGGGPGLFLSDKNDKNRLIMCLHKSGAPSLDLSDAKAESRVSLSLSSNDDPALNFLDESGKRRTTLSLAGAPHLHFLDENGAMRAMFGLMDTGDGSIGLNDSKGRLRWKAP